MNIHPNYNFPSNDIAILELDQPAMTSGPYVNTICLSNGEEPQAGEVCYATGFGATSKSFILCISVCVECRLFYFTRIICLMYFTRGEGHILYDPSILLLNQKFKEDKNNMACS